MIDAFDIELSDEQELALVRIADGDNLLITGNAGTGKSTLMRQVVTLLNPAVTASTGVAALQIGGETIHSWAGLGVGDKTAGEIITNLESRARQYGDRTLSRIRETRTLIVDEISMLSAGMVDLLDGVLCLARGDDNPFGGIQVIFVGDFLQLPPVERNSQKIQFAFQSQAWKEAEVRVRLLTHVFRQEEERFSRVLNKIRFDDLDDEVEAFLIERRAAEDTDPDHAACQLHTHNHKCEAINLRHLRELAGGGAKDFDAIDEGKHPGFVEQINRDCLAPAKLKLAVGARVMLLVNLNTRGGLVNGSTGRVQSWTSFSIQVLFDNGQIVQIERVTWEFKKGGNVVATRTQFPLRLSWAVTIHKSQGMTLDKVETDLTHCFAPGQAYVALSRARTSDGLFLRGAGVRVSAHPEAVAFYQQHCL